MQRPYSMASLHKSCSRGSFRLAGDRMRTTASSSSSSASLRGTTAGFRSSTTKVSPRTSQLQKTTVRNAWRQSSDVGDIAAAMAAVELALKSKERGNETDDLKSSMEEADRRIAEEAKREEKAAEDRARNDLEQERAIAKLRKAMRKGNLKSLKKAIDNALALEVPEAIISEAGTLWRLENQLRAAIAAANLPEVRKTVTEIEEGQQLATFPQEPPFAYQQRLQYWSDRRGAWVSCQVTQVSPDDGRILVDLKKKSKHWFTLHEQHERFRVPQADLAAAAPFVRIDEAKLLLARADALISALQSENVERVQDAMYDAGAEKALQSLIASAEKFVRRALKVRSDYENARRSDEAIAWHNAKQSIHVALKAEASRARSGAAGEDWGSLESGLLLERIEALEESLNQTDVNSLEAAIDRLEAEGLELPFEIISQAQEALLGIRRRHGELEEAIISGDVEGMNVSLDFAIEHLLPEELIQKAESTREAADSLIRAMTSRNEELLKKTLATVQKEFPNLPQVEQAIKVMNSINDFQEAFQHGDVNEILTRLQLISKAYIPEILLLRAEAVEQLAFALTSEDSRSMEEAARIARARGLPESLVDKAQHVFETSMSERKAREQAEMKARRRQSLQDFTEAIQGDDLSSRKQLYDTALKCGVPQEELDRLIQEDQKVKQEESWQEFRKAMQGDNLALRRKSLELAQRSGVPQEELDQLIEVDRSNAVNAVHDAMRNNNPMAIQQALHRARERGVPEDVLSCLIEEDRGQVVELLKTALQGDDLDAIDRVFRLAEGRFGKDSPLLTDFATQRTTKRLMHVFQGNDVAAIEKALLDAEQQGVPEDVVEDFRNQLEGVRAQKEEERQRDEELRRIIDFRARLEKVPEDSVLSLKAAIRECEEIGLEFELEMLREKLKKELNRRMDVAKEERAKFEKLAGEFKDAKEAQDFGGGILVAQWRAAVAEIAKPLTISEED